MKREIIEAVRLHLRDELGAFFTSQECEGLARAALTAAVGALRVHHPFGDPTDEQCHPEIRLARKNAGDRFVKVAGALVDREALLAALTESTPPSGGTQERGEG